MRDIRFNRCICGDLETRYVNEALAAGRTAGDGPFTAKCRDLLVRELGTKAALLTPSCTHALELAALLLDIQPGDEVILPSFTFVSTANAFVLRGARPVFIDIRPDTLNMDESLLEHLISSRTRAIVPVHYAGVGCEMDTICSIAAAHGIPVVEDNAQGLFGRYKGRHLGTFGLLAAQSFHESKNITCGEGGALLVNDSSLVERAEIVREKGTDRARFFRGEVDKYTWREVGSSYLLSDILAAVLLAQLENRLSIQTRREEIWEAYARGLQDWASANDVSLPRVPKHCEHTSHLFFVVLPSSAHRTRFIDELKQQGIQAVFHYQPLHASPLGRSMGWQDQNLPLTESISDRLVRLPLHHELTDEDVRYVIEAVVSFRT